MKTNELTFLRHRAVAFWIGLLFLVGYGSLINLRIPARVGQASAIYSTPHFAPTTPASRPRTVMQSAASLPSLGPGASLHGKRIFPPDNPWNQDISNSPVDPSSANLIKSIGLDDRLHPDFGTVWNGAPNGIPYVVVAGTQPRVNINYTAYGDESDPGPYPVPPGA